MKKLKLLFLTLVTFLFLVSQSFAGGLIGRTGGMSLVYNTTFTTANARNSFDATTAFCWANGLDLSTYAGTDAGSTPYMIRLEDASGDVAWGYAGAVGGGETLDSELLTNPTFDVNTTGWTPDAKCTIASVAGGQSNNCLELTWVSGLYQQVAQTISLTGGVLYKYSRYLKAGTAGELSAYCYVTKTSTGNLFTGNAMTTESWVSKTDYCVAPITAADYIAIFQKQGVDEGTVLFDEGSLKQVTDCAVTGLHIFTTKNKTTRGWASIGANFGYNDNLKVSIYRCY